MPATIEIDMVGPRRHGGFSGVLLASVGRPCAQRARCPGVVVRAAEAAAKER